MKRRELIKNGVVVAAAGALAVGVTACTQEDSGMAETEKALGEAKEKISELEKMLAEKEAPAIAQERIEIAVVSTWPRDFPGLGTGAQRFAKRLGDMSDGRFAVEYFAAG